MIDNLQYYIYVFSACEASLDTDRVPRVFEAPEKLAYNEAMNSARQYMECSCKDIKQSVTSMDF